MNRQLFINEFALNIVPLLAFVCICHATHYQNFMHSKAKQQTRRKKSLTLSLLESQNCSPSTIFVYFIEL